MKPLPTRLLAMLLAGLGCTEALPMAQAADGPDFGPNVLVFEPSLGMDAIQHRLDEVFAEQERSQFGPKRHACLFKPGKYDLKVRVGFYTQVCGLGTSPDDVSITGTVQATAGWMKGNATCNFWRAAENLAVVPTPEHDPMVWAVSQGASLRRAHIRGNLNLSEAGWSSGGFLADSKIDGVVSSGTQQQWLSRNAEWRSWRGGNWNMVFVGTTNPPEESWPEKPYTVIDRTPIIREKPYLVVNDQGGYAVKAPSLCTGGTRGITWGERADSGASIPIDRFFIARPDKDSAESINAALADGRHVLFTPGIYHLAGSLRVSRAGTVILGLGFPTLVPDNGTPAMIVSGAEGVTIAGLLFEAGPEESPTLLQIGDPGKSASHVTNPTVLHDVFCRSGGAVAGKARTFVTINADNVIGDNLWLWRADHGEGARWNVNTNLNGLIVNGDDVTMYGLFVEHSQEYQALWNGNGGRVYFYQSEMPYDPPSQEAWSHDGVRGYASYKVAPTVTTHEAWGLGVYCVFRAAPVVAETAIQAPDVPGVRLHHLITVRLNGLPGSGINHVINDRGPSVISTKTARMK
jgi:hypothetical protein